MFSAIGQFVNQQFHAKTGSPNRHKDSLIILFDGQLDKMFACIGVTIALIKPSGSAGQQNSVKTSINLVAESSLNSYLYLPIYLVHEIFIVAAIATDPVEGLRKLFIK